MSACACAASDGPAPHEASGLALCSSGSGTDLLCLPPGPGLGHQLARALHGVLAGVGRVTLPDYPGHGTPAPARDLADVRERVARLVTSATVLVGHSWGAEVAASVAAVVPCAALVLLAPPPPVEHATAWTPGGHALLAAVRAERTGTPYERYLRAFAIPAGLGGDRARADALLDGVPVYDDAWRALRGQSDPRPLADRVAAARALGTAVRVVAGADDPLCPEPLLDALAAAGAEVVPAPGGHYGFVDAPAAVRSAVGAMVAA
ncbi:MAG TPA: alpha/beta hydrolase [Frankiaceae bacterium]|nr:alpha/beta hydrolase [Frankiaceae bacterium]